MTLLITVGIFLLPVLSGGMFVHLLWPERDISLLSFKVFLGIGIGLGLSSLLYFLYLFAFAGRHWFVFLQLAIFLGLLAITVRTERERGSFSMPRFNLSRTQFILAGIAAIVLVVSLFGTASYLLRRQQGDWDAWMMYNRSARFIFRDQPHWLDSFSRQMDPIFHADYPLLLALNVASGWDTLGVESAYVQMLQSALFALATLGILVSALAALKSVGQASLGLIVLWGTPTLVNEGAREMADLPLAFFILSTAILIHLHFVYKKPALIVLAGLTAGLAAWTKNEGSLFVIAAGAGLIAACLRDKPWRVLFRYVLGLAFPFVTVVCFKLFLAPPSDVLSNGAARSIQQILEPSRHLEIVQYLGRELFSFGGWTKLFGVLPVLLVYFLLFRLPVNKELRPAFLAVITMLAVQLLGDYGVYLITPYDLTWHLSYSIERIVLQIFPVIAFLVLCASQTPEMIFGPNPGKNEMEP